MQSAIKNKPVHDEHLFIVTHQGQSKVRFQLLGSFFFLCTTVALVSEHMDKRKIMLCFLLYLNRER